MRILFVGPPLYGLLYPVLSLAQAFRVNGHEVLIASGGKFAQKRQKQGWWYLTPHPVLILKLTIAAARHSEKKATSAQNGQLLILQRRDGRPLVGCRTLAARSHHLPAARRHRASDCRQIRYTGRNANRRLRPYAWHIKGVTRSLADAYHRHGVGAAPRDMAGST